MISSKNRRTIFYLCRKLNYDTEIRHNVQHSVTGKESTTEMSDHDALKLIAFLKTELQKQSTKKGKQRNFLSHDENVINLMTPEQKSKIIALSMQIYSKFDENQVNRFCQRQFKKPFRRLTAPDAIELIEIQKQILKRKLRRTS